MLICDPCLRTTTPKADEISNGSAIKKATCEMCSTPTLTYDIPSEALIVDEITQRPGQEAAAPAMPPLANEVKPHIRIALDLYEAAVNAIEASRELKQPQLLEPLVQSADVLLRNIELVVGQATIPDLVRK